MTEQANGPIAGIEVPATKAVQAATELCRTTAEPYLVNHSTRSYFWAVHLAGVDGIRVDAELLWIAALTHDLGLTAGASRSDCFERVGADMAADLLHEHGWLEERVAMVTDAIVLHMAPELPADASATARALDAGVSLDVSGRRFEEVPADLRAAVLARYPRHDFKRQFEQAIDAVSQTEGPDCTAAVAMNELGLRDRNRNSPWPE